MSRDEIFITTKIQCGTYATASKQIGDNLAQLEMSSVKIGPVVMTDDGW